MSTPLDRINRIVGHVQPQETHMQAVCKNQVAVSDTAAAAAQPQPRLDRIRLLDPNSRS